MRLKLLNRLCLKRKRGEENQRVKTLIDIIFYEACIIEGEKISDTKDFIKKINILLSKN